MDRAYYLKLAEEGVRLVISADLVLHEREDPEGCRFEGDCLGQVIVENAKRFKMPLAIPLMDLKTEKEWMLDRLGVPDSEIDGFHFDSALSQEQVDVINAMSEAEPTIRMSASLGALRYVAANSDLVPVGMCIGPFSLMTKLLEDPITAAYMVAFDPEEESASLVLQILKLCTDTIAHWVELQIEAGAKAICVCEPAYNTVYISPQQVAAYPEVMDLLVLDHNRRIKATMEKHGVDLIFHDCGELDETLLRSINTMDPAILSLGSPCNLPEVADWISGQTVLMGNLPSKSFYSDAVMDEAAVVVESRNLLEAMRKTGHPFILGTECDVLCVSGCEHTIMKKVVALCDC